MTTSRDQRQRSRQRNNGRFGALSLIRTLLGMAIALAIARNVSMMMFSQSESASKLEPNNNVLPLLPHQLHTANQSKRPSPKKNVMTTKTNCTNHHYHHHFHQCTPTHHACDGYHGVLHIESGDFGGAGGTIFFQFVIAQLIYAEEHRLLPFLHLDNFSYLVFDETVHGTKATTATCPESTIEFNAVHGVEISTIHDPRWRRATYPGPLVRVRQGSLQPRTYELRGTGVWNHYFQPISNFCPGDLSCEQKPLVKMTKYQVSPELHLYAPWSPKIWRYGPLPAFIGKPHLPLHRWLLPQRQRASQIVQKYYKFQPLITDQINPEISKHCLGLHIRWSDKGSSRRKLALSEFLPFVQAYVSAMASSTSSSSALTACIYVATDASLVIEEIQSTWPSNIQDNIVYSGAKVRSPNDTAVFNLNSHHVTNQEVLRDILELSGCGFLLHGNSAVSESAIYLNPDLIYQSVNLEDPTHANTSEFDTVVRGVLSGRFTSDYWKEIHRPSLDWWEKDFNVSIACPHESTETSNATLILQPSVSNDYDFRVNQWTNRMFFRFLRHLVVDKVSVVEPIWYYWMEPTNISDAGEHDCKFVPPPNMQDKAEFLAKQFQENEAVKSKTSLVRSSEFRKQANEMLKSQMRFKSYILKHAEMVFNMTTHPKRSCLALHLPDPGNRRDSKKKAWVLKKYPKNIYQDYVESYVKSGGTCIYLATDSHLIWETFQAFFHNFTSRGNVMVYSQHDAVRNRENVPAHFMEEQFERLGSEVLVDVWNLHSCGIMVHGDHPVSEAALYWNSQLASIHVGDMHQIDTEKFSKFVQTLRR